MTAPVTRLVLASASPARLQTLNAAGISPEVVVSGVDESGIEAATPGELAGLLAQAKGTAVASRLADPAAVVIGCDSVLEIDGVAHGKPGTAEVATERWRQLRGRSGVLHTGHHVASGGTGKTRVGSTVVHFAELTDSEIAAYVATGEPLAVAGAFTLDGLAGAYITGIEGDPHNVVGISLPLLREMLAELGIAWHSLWAKG